MIQGVARDAMVVLFGYAVLGTYHRGGQFSPHINTLPEAVYVAVITMSTVGFGISHRPRLRHACSYPTTCCSTGSVILQRCANPLLWSRPSARRNSMKSVWRKKQRSRRVTPGSRSPVLLSVYAFRP
jgi:hypothetical protein